LNGGTRECVGKLIESDCTAGVDRCPGGDGGADGDSISELIGGEVSGGLTRLASLSTLAASVDDLASGNSGKRRPHW
jgi:hypothetical protein